MGMPQGPQERSVGPLATFGRSEQDQLLLLGSATVGEAPEAYEQEPPQVEPSLRVNGHMAGSTTGS